MDADRIQETLESLLIITEHICVITLAPWSHGNDAMCLDDSLYMQWVALQKKSTESGETQHFIASSKQTYSWSYLWKNNLG